MLTINKTATRHYTRTIARAVRELEAAGLADEARALRAFATARVEQARRQAAASDPDRVEIAHATRRTTA